jgi:hypothetical protein
MDLYLDGIKFDIEDKPVKHTYQISDVGDVKDKRTTFVNTILILPTADNIKNLDYLGVTGNLSRKAYTNISAKLISNSFELIPNGSIVISGSTTKGYECNIYDGIILLSNAIGNKALSSLNLTSLDHDLTPTNFINSFTNTTGYIYALSDFGRFDEAKIIINNQIPSVFVKTIWDKIFSEAGFTYSGAVFATSKFTDLVITPKRGYNTEFDAVTSPVNIIATSSQTFEDDGVSDWMVETNENIQFAFVANQSIMTGGTITILEGDTYDYSLTTQITYYDFNQFTNEFLILEVNGIDSVTYDLTSDAVVANVRNSVFAGAVSVLAGDVVKFRYRFTMQYDNIPHIPAVTFTSNFTFSNGSTVIPINYSQFIGEMLQIDFIKDIMQHFGLVQQKVKNSNDYEFVKIETLFNDKANSEDWSDKFISEDKQNYRINRYAQQNRFAYNYINEDSDPFADGLMLINNTTLPNDTLILTRPYNACETSANLLNTSAVCYSPFWEVERDDTGAVTKYKPIDSKNYIAEVSKASETIAYGLLLGGLLGNTGTTPRLNFANIKYQTLLDTNYAKFNDVLDDNLILTVSMNLTAIDINNLDFLKLKYIEQLGSYFYLNKVEYTEDRISKCELIKIPV